MRAVETMAGNLALTPRGPTVKFATEKCPDLVFAFTVPVVTQSALRGLRGAGRKLTA